MKNLSISDIVMWRSYAIIKMGLNLNIYVRGSRLCLTMLIIIESGAK